MPSLGVGPRLGGVHGATSGRCPCAGRRNRSRVGGARSGAALLLRCLRLSAAGNTSCSRAGLLADSFVCESAGQGARRLPSPGAQVAGAAIWRPGFPTSLAQAQCGRSTMLATFERGDAAPTRSGASASLARKQHFCRSELRDDREAHSQSRAMRGSLPDSVRMRWDSWDVCRRLAPLPAA